MGSITHLVCCFANYQCTETRLEQGRPDATHGAICDDFPFLVHVLSVFSKLLHYIYV